MPQLPQVMAWTAVQVSDCSGTVDHDSGIKIEFTCISICPRYLKNDWQIVHALLHITELLSNAVC